MSSRKRGRTGAQPSRSPATTAKAPAGGAQPTATKPAPKPAAKPRRAMPAGAEAVRAERQERLARRVEISPALAIAGDSGQGRGIILSAWIGTAVFIVTTLAAAAVPSARIVAVLVDLALLLAGSGLYLLGWGVAAGRSRESQISLWNLILLEDAAPNRVRAHLLGATAVQVLVAGATCWITAALAFGWLVPMWGVAHCELWGARYGVFAAREPSPTRGQKGSRGRRR